MNFKTFINSDPRKIADMIKALSFSSLYAWPTPYYVRVGAGDKHEEKRIDNAAKQNKCKAAEGRAGEWVNTDIVRLESKQLKELAAEYELWRSKRHGKKAKQSTSAATGKKTRRTVKRGKCASSVLNRAAKRNRSR